jgi:LuxR family maltose regulon positive regulatory protein
MALMNLLDNLLDKHIIYIHAPAGFGKTVSSLLWLDHREAMVNAKRAWVSLDEYDNKTAEFCVRFAGALLNLQPENATLRNIAENPSFRVAPVDLLLRALGALKEEQNECIFVLDDLHQIKNDEILTLMPVLFKRLPRNCTVLLLSRAASPDSFSEMVAKEELAVLDAGYLQFTSGEIKLFFDKNGHFLTASQADEILASTGGWAIGIRALLLSEEKSYSINLTGRYLENYLKTHVWERWDEQLKRFMILISVAEELTPELGEWLAADDMQFRKGNAAEILIDLARENAFLRATGNNTYRFHDLFREFLVCMLKESSEQTANRQWNRAGKYYYDKKDYFRAVAYYLKGDNDDGVAESLYCMYNHFSSCASIEDTLYSVHSSVNDSIVKKHPFLLEVQAWAALTEGRPDDFEAYLDKYYNLIPKIVLNSPRSIVTLMLLRCTDYRESFIKTMRTVRPFSFKGSFKAATPTLTFNMPYFHRSGRDFSEIALDIDRNAKLTQKSVGAVFGEEFAVINECFYAGFYYEKGYLNEALEHALTACTNISDNCSPEIIFCAMMISASILFADGQNADANKTIDDVSSMIERKNAFYLNANFQAYKFRIKLTNGDKKMAEAWLRDCDNHSSDNLSFYKSYIHFTTARAYIVMGNYTDATVLLKKLLGLCERYRRTLDIIDARILLAIVYWKKGHRGQSIALDYLEQAVLTAHKYGFTQAFANEGAELVNMLQRLQKRSVQTNYSGEIPAGFLKALYIAAVAGAKRSKGLTGGRAPEDLTFTNKQKSVMALLCEGCSRNEIAGRMGLKPYTVKSHIELVYRKLDVSNSVDAVLKIKELGILNG